MSIIIFFLIINYTGPNHFLIIFTIIINIVIIGIYQIHSVYKTD